MSEQPFHIRIRIGDIEVELGGDKQEVLSTLDDLESIVYKVSKAFNKEINSSIHEPSSADELPSDDQLPKIPRTSQCSEALISLLSTEWGKTPRPIGELRVAMEANAVFFPKTTLSGVLIWLVKKGSLRRWKDKKRGYLYVLADSEES